MHWFVRSCGISMEEKPFVKKITMEQKYKKNKYYICPKVNKPIYETDDGSYVGIYDKHINEAIHNRQMILVITNWRGKEIRGTYMPKQWKKGQKINKVFLRPNQPMILYGGIVLVPKQKTAEEKLRDFEI